jgi:methyl-accepting chemotaxis protein
MSLREEIIKAVGAHGEWKMRLKSAIANGKSEFQVSTVQKDNECPFGKWLNSVEADMKASADFEKVRQLHAKFHTEAANVLGLALKGDKATAEKSLESGGAFTQASSELTNALMAWRSSSSS